MIMTFHFDGASRRGVVLLLLALFVSPAVGYSADPSSMVSEGYGAYEARDYAQCVPGSPYSSKWRAAYLDI